jgi:thioredoxin-like negative regulator of GroEL
MNIRNGLPALLLVCGLCSYASQATGLLLNKARALEGRGLMDLAARSWEQVLLAEPNNAEALAGLARYTKMNGRKAEADRYLERLRSVDPQNAAIGSISALRSLDQQKASLDDAQRLAEKKDFDGAFRIYRQVFGNEPPPGNWAVSYYETQAATPGGWNDATAALRRLLAKYPGSPDYALALGKLLTYRPKTRAEGMQILEAMKGDAATVSKARAAWRQALLWEAGNSSSLPSLRSYLARYPDSELSKFLSGKEKLSPGTPQPAGHSAAASESEAVHLPDPGKMNDATQESSSTPKPVRRGSSNLARLAFIRMKEQDFASAIALFERALAEDPPNKTISEGLATARFWNYMKQGSDDLTASRASEASEKFKAALALRPQSPEALRALAGSYELQGKPLSAVPVYLQLTHGGSAPSDDWFGLVRSQYNSGDVRSALRSLSQVPANIQESWSQEPERAILLAFVHAEGGNDETARSLAAKVEQVTSVGSNLSNGTRMQLAGLYMRLRDPSRAASLYDEVTRTEPAVTGAWAGLIDALSQQGQRERADSVLERMPPQAYQDALKRPEFLRSMAKLEIAQARYDRAEVYLRKAAEIEAMPGRKTETETQLQLAEIWTHTGKSADAEQLLRHVTAESPDSAPAWQALISLLHAQKKDKAAFEVLQSIPEKTYLSLRNDYGFAAVEAGIYAAVRRYDEALNVVRSAAARAQKTGASLPADLRIQEAWILLNSKSSERELYEALNAIGPSGLSQAQQQDLDSIWSIWSQRRAAAALDRGDITNALKILRTALRLFPENSRLNGSLAGAYLQAGDMQDAFLVYKNWGLKDATADDFNGAIGSAMAAHDKDAAQRWLNRGLHKFPRDSRLLSLAGKQAAQRGDYERAKLYFREALASLPSDESGARRAFGDPVQDNNVNTKEALGALLVDGDPAAEDGAGFALSRAAIRQGPHEIPVESDKKKLEARRLPPLPRLSGAAYFVEPSSTEKESSGPSLHEQITADLGAIGARNTPYFTNGAIVQGRTGQGGVDKLLIEEANLEASTTIGDRVRLSLVAKPTYLDSGNPDSTHELGFGSVDKNGTSSSRSAFGVGVEGQISTRDFGLRLGMSPNDFLVHNWIGGLRVHIGNSPFTVLLNRDSIRDTKLSFAGERDANTNQVWGGVMAGSASILGNWGDEKSGFYTSAGYQDIRGKGVAPNTRIDLTMGAYFKVLTTKDGSLTAGLNFSGMHYDKNLRYFTLGQGGYFSPQQYFLTNVPVRWNGTWNRVLQYSISGSLGVQHFQEEASRYFPLRQDKGGTYPALASTGGNYNLDFRLGYQLTPQWLAGAFASVGNARDYRNSSAGIFLRYLFQPRPFSADIAADSIPDWKGSQPFGLPLN